MVPHCSKCNQPLDVARPKLKVCGSCGAAVSSKIILQQWGAAALIKQEADAVERQKAGKSLTSLQNCIAQLRTLKPEETEFYTVAATYLRKLSRPNRTYGMFFIILGSIPVLLVVSQRSTPLQIFIFLGGYLFFGALGLQLYYQSSASLKNLPPVSQAGDPDSRLRGLRNVALNNQQDPVAALVLQLTVGKARPRPHGV